MADQCTVISNQEQFTICIRSVFIMRISLASMKGRMMLTVLSGIKAHCSGSIPHSQNVVANATMAHQIDVGAGRCGHTDAKRKSRSIHHVELLQRRISIKRKGGKLAHDFFCLADTGPKKCIAITEMGIVLTCTRKA